jgi:hypothetical protein
MADTAPIPPLDDLYEADFYVWTQEQAQRLRDLARAGGRVDRLDWINLAEEVEDLGRQELSRAQSLVQRILEHLFKLAWTRSVDPVRGWRKEIRAWRPALRRTLDRQPSLRRLVEESLDRLHADAIAAMIEDFRIDEPASTPDTALRWTLPQILGEADDPLDA